MPKTLEYYLSLPYSIVLTPLSADDGAGWLAEIPLLKGCITDGDTQVEALTMLEDAKRGWLEVALENGESIPEPETLTQGQLEANFKQGLHEVLTGQTYPIEKLWDMVDDD